MSREEVHPLSPFIPAGARLLLLGSFPPPRSRWCMEFFYPNPSNDMWRIMGLILHGDRNRYWDSASGSFLKDDIEKTLSSLGIALYDMARRVVRLKDNASDEFLEVLEPTDIPCLLKDMPLCGHIAATGGKAFSLLASELGATELKTGQSVQVTVALDSGPRTVTLHRMPSTSRAYPLSLEKKADFYRRLLCACGVL